MVHGVSCSGVAGGNKGGSDKKDLALFIFLFHFIFLLPWEGLTSQVKHVSMNQLRDFPSL